MLCPPTLANAALPVLFEQAPGPPGMSTSLPIRAFRRKSEGARDAGVAMDPRTLAPRGTKATRPRTGPVPGINRAWQRCETRRCRPQVHRTFGVPRAVFNRLAPQNPRWADLSGAVPFFVRVQRLPTAVGTEQHLAVGSAVRRCIRRSTGDARLAHRDPAAWAAARGLANPPRGHRPNRPGCPRSDPGGLAAHLRRRLRPSPHLSALERALGWDEVCGI